MMRWQLVMALMCALGISQTSCGSKVECGSGTTEKNGRCVSSGDASIECGAGTEEEDGVCVVTGEQVACGDGTMLDANSGECVATASGACGANTAFDEASDSCLPTDTVCAIGTTFDAAMGVCMPDIACQAGDIVMDGICVAPFEELWPTATVTSMEPDDPFRGDNSTPITLPAEGAELVISGTIDAPTDVDGDGFEDNDLDGFEFTTTGPQWLTISVQSETEALIGFLVANEDDTWTRQAPLAGPRGNAREVLIPQAGTYRLGIGTPVIGHAVGSRWVASIEADAMPAPLPFTFGGNITGTFDAPESGHLIVDTFSGVGRLTATDWPEQAQAALMVFDGVSWTQVATWQGVQESRDVFGAAPLQMFIDPIEYGSQLDRAYTISSFESVTVDLGAITSGQTLMSAPIGAETVFSVDAPAGVVLEITTTSVEPVDVQVLGPYSSFQFTDPGRPGVITSQTAGMVTFSIASPLSLQPFVVSVEAITPTDLGVVPSQGTLTEMVGALGIAYYTVAFTTPEVGRIRQSNTAQDPLEVIVWGSDWTTEQRELLEDQNRQFGQPVTLAGAPGPQLVGFRADFMPLTGVELTFQGVGTTALGTFAAGDTISATDPVARLRSDDAFLAFTLSTDARLTGPIEGSGADLNARITDSSGIDVWTGFSVGGEFVDVFLPAGDYTITVIARVALPSGFTLDIDLGALPSTMEVEPNNTAAMASSGLALGNDVLGSGGPDDDWYTFTVANAGIFTARATLLGFGSAELEIADAVGASLPGTQFGEDTRGFLEVGTYTVRVRADGDYIVSVIREDSGADFDDAGSNDTLATAQAITATPGTTVMGMLGTSDEDWYSFTVVAPADVYLGAVSTAGGSRANLVELLDSTMTVVTPVAGAYALVAGSYYIHVSGAVPDGFPDYTFAIGTLPGTAYSSAPALAIPDNTLPMTVSDTINVPAACTITNIAVQFDLTHTFIGDLEIHVVSPLGTDVMLWSRGGGPTDDLVGVFGISLTPVQSLSGLIGEEAMGDWTITVGDGANVDTGTLNSWGVLVDCQ